MIIYGFEILLSNGTDNELIKYDSKADNYCNAWRDATEYAIWTLSQKTHTWFIESINYA